MSVITRSMAKKLAVAEVVHQQPSEPSPWPSITDLPPEVLEMILRNLDCGKNSLLPYRLVSPLWKSIIDDLLEKKTLKGDVDGCPTLRTSTEWLTVRCPGEMLHHNGNPFPSSALIVAERQRTPRGISAIPFQPGFSFGKDYVKSRVSSFNIHSGRLLMKKEEPFGSLPALPHLTKLELNSNVVASSASKSVKFCSWFVDAYAEQLEYLELKPVIYVINQLDPLPPSSLESSPMQKLRQLKIFNAGPKFLQLSGSPPFLNASLHRKTASFGRNESRRFDDLCGQSNRVGEGDVNQLDMMLKRFYGEDANRTGGRLSASTEALVFPKLTKLTFPYPSNVVESAVINKLMLPKFPALRKLKLGYCGEVFGIVGT
ncbi:hypothetical protein Ocin01_19508 [Orchesella cincta]|uniref:F-box domain-containing protein n=1 Tax=Orchesella cincta TaxID=48709 RepID=A0A1D2M2K0_ORCCI|nr:hypothetical protein Ocin01_19508 [Orchesella cincta]